MSNSTRGLLTTIYVREISSKPARPCLQQHSREAYIVRPMDCFEPLLCLVFAGWVLNLPSRVGAGSENFLNGVSSTRLPPLPERAVFSAQGCQKREYGPKLHDVACSVAVLLCLKRVILNLPVCGACSSARLVLSFACKALERPADSGSTPTWCAASSSCSFVWRAGHAYEQEVLVGWRQVLLDLARGCPAPAPVKSVVQCSGILYLSCTFMMCFKMEMLRLGDSLAWPPVTHLSGLANPSVALAAQGIFREIRGGDASKITFSTTVVPSCFRALFRYEFVLVCPCACVTELWCAF